LHLQSKYWVRRKKNVIIVHFITKLRFKFEIMVVMGENHTPSVIKERFHVLLKRSNAVFEINYDYPNDNSLKMVLLKLWINEKF
ncbi:MAG: hypothetical protein ACXACP_05245, partial [Candidatus Hodarchaeales archaeon]